MNGIKQEQIFEGNIMVVKDRDDFGGPNMWRLHIRTTDGYWENVQWMDVSKAQLFLKTKLNRYEELNDKKYRIKN